MVDKYLLQFKIDKAANLSPLERDYLKKLLYVEKKQHGKWKHYPCVSECSICRFWIEPKDTEYYKYCPRCGGIMDGG